MSISRKFSVISAVALTALSSLGPVVSSASAQSIFASPRAASAAGVAYNGNSKNSNYAAANDSTPSDPNAPADPYAAIFGQIQTAASALLSGPGALAFGVLILGLGFGVAWRLTTKGVKSIAK